MAAFDVDFPDDFMQQFLGADFGDIAEEALAEAAPLLEQSMKTSCQRVIEHEGESELVESIKPGKPFRAKTDAWIVTVSPRGYSETKVYREKEWSRKLDTQ